MFVILVILIMTIAIIQSLARRALFPVQWKCSSYRVIISTGPPWSEAKWKNANKPTGAAVPWNSSFERASGWPFFILALNKGGQLKKSPAFESGWEERSLTTCKVSIYLYLVYSEYHQIHCEINFFFVTSKFHLCSQWGQDEKDKNI